MKPAQIAQHAAKNRKIWGRFATRQYIKRHGVHLSLYRLACQLEGVKNA